MDDKCILVGLSGGKDSVSLLYALWKLKEKFGYKLKALHIKLGIFDYTELSYKISQELCEKLSVPLIVFDVKGEFGWGIPEASMILRKPACSVCGIVKRWVMNKVAMDEDCDYVATGHNVDDFNSFGLKALLTYRLEDIFRISKPILEPKKEYNLVGRIRPQFYLTEFENTMYAHLNNLNFVTMRCPLATRTTQHKYKGLWEHINKVNPVGKINFAKSLVKISEIMKESENKKIELAKCKICGQPTVKGREICSFCSMRKKISEKLNLKDK